uniref:Uncharacterized protein n=1 Tax=Octopus bimaculoides TaxID=37653 RepID=A0A0L8HEI8_OCTBM
MDCQFTTNCTRVNMDLQPYSFDFQFSVQVQYISFLYDLVSKAPKVAVTEFPGFKN